MSSLSPQGGRWDFRFFFISDWKSWGYSEISTVVLKKWRISILADMLSSFCHLHFWATPLPAWLPKTLLSIQQAKNTLLYAPWSTLPLFTCLPSPPDLFTGPFQPVCKTHADENMAGVKIRPTYAWPISCKQKHSKNTCIWVKKWPNLSRSVCLPAPAASTGFTPSQREKLILQMSSLWVPHFTGTVTLKYCFNLKY